MKQALCIERSALPEMKDKNVKECIIVPNRMDIFTKKTFLLDREVCETDLNYVQIIPYVTLIDRKTSEIFVYTRGQAGNEKRLTGKCSIGIGGHIEEQPNEKTSFLNVVIESTMRELNEEVGIPISTGLRKILFMKLTNDNYACLYINDTDVDKVHLGLSIMLIVNKEDITDAEKNVICNGQWQSVKGLRLLIDEANLELENWSKVVFSVIENHKKK